MFCWITFLLPAPDNDHVGMVRAVAVSDALFGSVFVRFQNLIDVIHFEALERTACDAGRLHPLIKQFDAHVALGCFAVDFADDDCVIRTRRFAQTATGAVSAVKNNDAVGTLYEALGGANCHA